MKTNNTTKTTSKMVDVSFEKRTASQEPYSQLYNKYIPDMYNTSNSDILIYGICNIGCIESFTLKNPSAKYHVYDIDNDETKNKDILRSLMPNVNFEFISNKYDNVDLYKQFKYNLYNMKFNCIIMNPPYHRNLHLKILEEAIKLLKDDDSICINLSPDTWIHEFADVNKRSDYNKFSKLPFINIDRLGLLNKYFDLGHTTYTGAIYVCAKHQTNYNIESELYSDICLPNKTVMPKTLNKKLKHILVEFVNNHSSLESHIITGNPDITTKWTRYIPRLVGNPGDRCSNLASIGSKRWDKTFYKGKFEGKTFGETKKQLSNVKNYSMFDYIEFDTEQQAINWRNSSDTAFMKYICTLVHIDANRHANWIPWMGEAINPRTGLKGYESDWTDEDFYTYFNITSDEQKIIEETMEKYK